MEVVPYNPAWQEEFQAERNRVAWALGENVLAIHHMGSTAIPGIKAKPIIDLLVEVISIAMVDACQANMATLGYKSHGEHGIPGRRYFSRGINEQHTHHMHVYERGHEDIQRVLRFRDYLIAHPEEAQRYSQLKERLSEEFRFDPTGYTDSKSEFIQEINRKAHELELRSAKLYEKS
jgi:GrpB-like predicted nucleotidyltransferase (UPF0157 family)